MLRERILDRFTQAKVTFQCKIKTFCTGYICKTTFYSYAVYEYWRCLPRHPPFMSSETSPPPSMHVNWGPLPCYTRLLNQSVLSHGSHIWSTNDDHACPPFSYFYHIYLVYLNTIWTNQPLLTRKNEIKHKKLISISSTLLFSILLSEKWRKT